MPFLKRKPVLMHPLPSMSSIIQPVTDKPTQANGDASPGTTAPSAPPDDIPKDSTDDEEQLEKLLTALNDPNLAAPARKTHKDKVNGVVNGTSTARDMPQPGSASLPSYRVKDVEVFYLPETGEIFLDYETYALRQAFLDQPLFQCEVSGKSGLSYFEARENEQREARQLHRRFPKQLKKAVLESVQYQVEGKLETLADKIFERFVNRFFDDEKIFVDVQGDKYLARVVRTFPPKDLVLPEGASSPYHPYATDLDLDAEVVVERDDPMKYFYQVRLIEEGGDDEASVNGSSNEEGKGEEFQGSVMEVQADKISRDRINFSRAMLKRFIRDCVSRDAAVFSPWIVKKPVALRYGLPTEMSDEIREKIEKIRSSEKTRKKRERDARLGITHSEGEEESKPEKKKRKTKAEREKEKEEKAEVKEEEKEKEEEEKKKKRGLKYPCEDLLLEFSQDRDATAGRVEVRPKPERSLPFGQDFEKLLFTWSFLNVMGKPLGLSPFTLDDYEQSLLHTDELTAPAPILVEVHAALLNALIRDLEEGHEPVKPIVHWGLDFDNDTDYWEGTKGATTDTLRPVAEPLGESWTKKQLSYKDGRKGWESVLVGCLWDRADVETLKPYLNYILHLTFEDKPPPTRPTWSTGPSTSSSHGLIPSKPERRYTSLPHNDKLNIISFLIDLVTQTANIRDFFEESTNAVTEVRKDLVDVRRDLRKNHAEQDALEPKKEKAEDGDEVKEEVPSSVAPSPNGHVNGTATNTERDELEGSMMGDETSRANSPASEADRVRTAASRRRAMKEKALEREAEEAERQAALLRERAEAKLKRAESKQISQEKKRLAEAEEDLENRQRQLDYEFRRNNQVLRVKPIGLDRYGNRVWWLDGIGSAGLYDGGGKVTFGTGRIFLQGAEEFDLEHNRTAAELTEEQLRERRSKEEDGAVLQPGEWAMYDSLDALEGFKNWLNPRGYREHHLLRFLNQWWPEITQGVQKRRLAAGLDGTDEESHGRRLRPSRRAAGDEEREGYLGWKNKRASGGRH